MSTIRSLAALAWLWIRITAVLAMVAFVAGAVLHAIDPLRGEVAHQSRGQT